MGGGRASCLCYLSLPTRPGRTQGQSMKENSFAFILLRVYICVHTYVYILLRVKESDLNHFVYARMAF